MLLTIDIGNSSTKFGAFDGENLRRRLTIPTVRTQSAREIFEILKEEIDDDYEATVVSSVVPELGEAYRALGETYFKRTPFFVDNRFDFGMEIKYQSPEKLGIDRLVAAFAASRKYGAPAIVCDFGTATTIDAVGDGNEFLGGVITPGMNTLADALHLKTSKLPRVEIRQPASVIGTSTVEAIQAGIFFGYIGLTEGILTKMIGELGEKPKTIATGGFANLIAENCDLIEIVDENLMLEGLRLVYQKLAAK